MTLRRKSREFALQMLFEWDVTRQKASRVEQHFWKSARAADSTRKFANQLFEGAIAEAEPSDKLVQKLSENWKLERLAAVDRSILRLAIYELRFGTAPPKVVIDEALELAKKFSSADSASFLEWGFRRGVQISGGLAGRHSLKIIQESKTSCMYPQNIRLQFHLRKRAPQIRSLWESAFRVLPSLPRESRWDAPFRLLA